MLRTKKIVRALSALSVASVVLLPLALLSTEATTTGATTSRHPPCLTSQINVTVGTTASNVSYDYSTSDGTVHAFSKKATPVYFYNKGTVCHLLMRAPSIRAVKNASNVRAITASDLSFSAQVPSEKRVVVGHHQKVEALFLFGNPVAENGRGCDPATATGILVQGYANPMPSAGKFFPQKMRQVCFDSGVGAIVSNTGVAWATPN